MVKYVVKRNPRNKRYIVFKAPKKGRWKIVKSFKTKSEADKWVRRKK